MSFTLPPIQPHTQAKHHILRYYLNEWFPILGRTHGALRYIDGFSGPGEYEGGDQGSPLVALNTIRGHSYFDAFAKEGKTIDFLFVDKESDFCRHLKIKIEETYKPHVFGIEVEHGEFEDVVTRLLDDIENHDEQMPPTLIFIDPFGPAGFSMDLLARLSTFRRMEVLINLNYNEFVQWILPDPTKHVTADRLYGGPRWRPALDLIDRERADFLVSEYEAALSEIGWRGTSFEMVNVQNQTAYYLVFGTQYYKGLEAMNRAMRDASQTGEFRYTDRIDPSQPTLIGLERENEYPREIGEYLFSKYDGQEVCIDRLIEVEVDWHRQWLLQDLRKGLNYLEHDDIPRILEVRNGDGRPRRKNSYPEGCYITFGRKPQGRLFL